MGQYFKLVNVTKKEYICPYDLGQTGKLWEWCANNTCRILPFLLRKSNEGGGGDIQKDYKTAGRWAGDKVYLVGDYDRSKLYDIVETEKKFKNISKLVKKEFNDFIEDKDLQLLSYEERQLEKLRQ